MCARIIQNVDVHVLGRIYRVQTDNTFPPLPIRWNGPPGDRYAVCRSSGEQREIAPMKWGLVRAWARSDDFAPHNARAETAATKPTFRDAWRRRRAVLPVNGWYEWRKPERTPKAPSCTWRRCGNAGTARTDRSTVSPCSPRPHVAAIHNRQPAVLESEAEIDDWLDPTTTHRRLMALAAQPGSGPLRIHQVLTGARDRLHPDARHHRPDNPSQPDPERARDSQHAPTAPLGSRAE